MTTSRRALTIAILSGLAAALGAAATAAVQAAPSGSIERISQAPPTTWQSGASPLVRSRVRSWMLPQSSRTTLVYTTICDQPQINVYAYPSGNLVGQIGSANAEGQLLALSPRGDLYAPSTNGVVYAFHRGQTSPFRTLDVPGGSPRDAVVRNDGTVFVSTNPGQVYVYRAKHNSPARQLQGVGGVGSGVALDRAGNLYVGATFANYSAEVAEFVHARGQPIDTDIQPSVIASVAVDLQGDIIVSEYSFGVDVYEVGNGTPLYQITSAFSISAALSRDGHTIFVAGDASGPAISVFAYPSGQYIGAITNGLGVSNMPCGVAVDPGEAM